MTYSEHILLEDDDLMWQPFPWTPYAESESLSSLPLRLLQEAIAHQDRVGCSLPDMRYVVYGAIVAAGALLAIGWLVRDVWKYRSLS